MSRITFCLSCRGVAAYPARLRSKDLHLEDNRYLICAAMWDEVKADKETVMNLYEMSCPALTQSQVACNRIMNYFHPFYFFLTITLGHPKLLNLHLCQLQSVVFVICQTSNSTSSDMLEAKCAQIWLEVFSGEYPMKILLSGFLLSSSSSDCWHVFFLFFLMGLVQTLQRAAMSHWPSLKRPQQITAQGREE